MKKPDENALVPPKDHVDPTPDARSPGGASPYTGTDNGFQGGGGGPFTGPSGEPTGPDVNNRGAGRKEFLGKDEAPKKR